ncbi:MAG: glycosyltransferase family 2 protein, partial [Desemzia incerta]
MDFINILMLFFGSLIAFYMLSIIGSYIVMLLIASSEEGRQTKLDKKTQDADYINAAYAKPISIIVPAYNEEEGILESVYSLLNIRYPQVEYIIVNDGSTDSTLSKVIKEFEMVPVDRIIRKQLDTKEVKQIYRSLKHPNLVLVDKLNGGKADALNTGINVAKYPYFCSIDGDSILEKNALLRVMKPIINSNEEVIAAGGTIRIVNDLTVESGTIAGKGLAKNPLVIM